MNINIKYLPFFITTFFAWQSYATNLVNNIDFSDGSGMSQSKSSMVGEDKTIKKVPDHDSYDVSKEGVCEVCKKLSLTICSKCKKVFYCSKVCQKKEYQKHKEVCYDYYHNPSNILERKEYTIFLNSDDCLSFLQYYTKDEQVKSVAFYLMKQEEKYQLIMPQDIKSFIFLMVYDPPQNRNLHSIFGEPVQRSDSQYRSLSLSSKNPMYLIRFLQYMNQEESSRKEIDKTVKKCLLQKIAHVNWILGSLFCFSLQKKMIVAFMKVMKKADYEVLRAISDMGYSEMKSPSRYYPCELDAYCAFFFMLEKGQKKALQYASVRGWCNLIRKLAIGNKKHFIFCERTPHSLYTCCSNLLARSFDQINQRQNDFLDNMFEYLATCRIPRN